MPMIAGHRQVAKRGIRPATFTACPGRYGQRWLTQKNGLRDRVARYISRYNTPIKRKQARLGGRSIGSVHAAERRTRGGYKTVFTKSTGYYKKGYGTSFIKGPILSRYKALRQERGVLGFVRTNIHRSKYDRSLTRAGFEDGRIFARRGTAYSIYGPIWTRYRKLRQERGRLGRPTTNVYSVKGGKKRARFARGYITWNTQTDRVRVVYR